MLQSHKYSVIETLRDGHRLEIRALTSDDRSDLIAAVARTSAESLRRRFFVSKRSFTDQETAFFLNVDFVNHVALVAVLEEGDTPVIAGGRRYIVVRPGEAEIAFAVVDQYQGHGIGKALMRHLAAIAQAAGLKRLSAEVLAENLPMLRLFEQSGLRMRTKRKGRRPACHASTVLIESIWRERSVSSSKSTFARIIIFCSARHVSVSIGTLVWG
jgi:ribosomal protein S18 acetylase RimI-like enzyme